MAFISNSSYISNNFMLVGSNSYDTSTTTTYITKVAPTTTPEAWFGTSVAIGSRRIVIGAPCYIDGFSYNGDPGSAYIYDTNCNLVKTLTPSGGVANTRFGYGVSVGNDRIVIGAIGDTTYGYASGAAYLYDLEGNLIKKITASDTAAYSYFGYASSIGDGRIVIGAWGANTYTGAAYMYDLDGNFINKITANDAQTYDYFGQSVAVGNGRIIIGAPGDDDNASSSGAAYLYDLNCSLISKLKPATNYNAAVGAYTAIGNGKVAITGSGRVFVYSLNGSLLATITSNATGNAISSSYPSSIDIADGRLVVGDYNSKNYNYDSGNVYAMGSGSVYVYNLDNTCLEWFYPVGDNFFGDYYGRDVAIGHGRIIVGCNGDGGTSDTGSAYLYSTPEQKHFLDNLLE